MSLSTLQRIFNKQKAFFYSHETFNPDYRKIHLKALLNVIDKNYEQIVHALKVDLNKSEAESYISEILLVRNEIKTMIKNINRWAKPKKTKKNLLNILSRSYILKEPYGVVLICAPWNYPFQLALIPLIDAIAAGNVAIVYVSPYVPTVNKILTQIIHQVFNSEYVEVVTFAQASYEEIMIPQYDYVFFTGSPRVGKIIMKQASENLIPITLELGGKSPCIVDETANINIAAKRIIRGKLMNSGQTCVAPDYLLVNKTIKAPLIKALIKSIQDFYGENVIQQRSLPKIINLQHFNRLLKTIKNQKILYGGKSDSESLIIEPTIIDIKSFKNKIMEEEIFGPILPIITFDNLEKVISDLRQLEKPLALYIFSKNSYHINQLTRSVQSGDCCINDTIMHITNEHLPFGGVGHSGMGSYHGIHGFNTFSHTRSLVVTTQKIDSSLFYPPWTKTKLKLIKSIM